jgi:hypothetical protein
LAKYISHAVSAQTGKTKRARTSPVSERINI